jgi:predicted MPP superfamily phosphohydrolase
VARSRPSRITRRAFLRAASASVGAATGLGLYTWRVEPHWLEVVRRPLDIRRLPPSLAGRTLIQISDVHVGPRVDDEYVLTTFRRISELRPDIVVFTGDFVSYGAGVFDQLRRVYREFPKGRLGTIGILGNHDYGPNWAHPEFATAVVDIVQTCGITVLRNQVCEIEGLQVAGFDDLWAEQFRPEQVVARLDLAHAAIALSHNPDTVDLPGWGDYSGWILSGHTHGGQCKPPFLPPPLLPVRNRRYTAGEFALTNDRRLYISRGVGHLLHVRFNVRPEVTVFELRSA